MPRESRRNGQSDRKLGISNEQVCILMAIDSNDTIFIKVIGLGQITIEQLENNLSNHIEEKSILVTDSKNSYVKFAENHNLILKQIPHKKHITKDGYHLGEINSLMSELDILLLKCRGLSTRHLQEYLDLFRFRKILKYTYEYLERNEELYKYSLIQNSSLNARNVCKKSMPIDITILYDSDFE